MPKFVPWYERASRIRLMLYGLIAGILLSLFMHDPITSLNILFDSREWAVGERPYFILGELTANGLIGGLAGAIAFWMIQRKASKLRGGERVNLPRK